MVYSNWRQELTEVMTDKEDDKKVTEKKVKNKVIINPKLGEAIEAMGGQLLEMVEMVKPEQEQSPQEKEKEDPKQKKISQVKKQVLMKKMQAVRQGAGSDIVAHYEPEGDQIDEKKGCSHTHKGEECPVHGKKECPDIVAAEVDEGKGDPCWDSHKQVGMKKKGNRMVPNCVPKNEEVELDERTRYAKETGKDFKTGNPSEKGGTRTGKSAFDQVSRQMRKTGGVMSSRGKAIQPQGKKKEPGKKGYKGVTPVDKIRNRLSRKRAEKPNPYKARPGESD